MRYLDTHWLFPFIPWVATPVTRELSPISTWSHWLKLLLMADHPPPLFPSAFEFNLASFAPWSSSIWEDTLRLASDISLFSTPSAAAHPVFEKIYIVLKVNILDRFNIATHSSNLPTIRFCLVGLTAWIASFHHVRDHSVKLIAFFCQITYL